MAENFVVNYDINVFDNGSKAINAFIAATNKLTQAQQNFNKLNNQLNSMQQKLVAFSSQKAYKISINTQPAIQNVDKLMRRLKQLESYAKGMGVTVGQVVGTGGVQTGRTTRTSTNSSSISRSRAVRQVSPAALKYHALGQTLMDSGGVGIFDLVKGMGVAYGITGLGSLFGNVIKDSSAYDNIMQSTKNILKSHDKGMNFAGRFSGMESIIRNVGIQTKFTAPEVADASKFLAMAGFDIDAINKAIRPIADIALIGDTDLGQTADVVTNIMTGYGITPDKVRNAADIMTQTFTMTNTTLMEMAEAYKYAGSLLARNNTPFEEATAAIGILGDAGIKGSQAGTTLRTIAANFAKPTSNQAEAWNRIGVKTTDAYGNTRSLISIFQDLAAKNLSLNDYYSIFHKTAASGASSLAANVEKWNEVIRQNFMSAGMSKDLAEAKKNTIQGLWAQLTSSFTEAGMRAFESMQYPIKNAMKSVIQWLQSEEGISMIKRMAEFIKSLIESLMDLSKMLFVLYKRFEPLAKFWLKTQMFSSAILIPLRAISAVKGFLNYLKGSLGTVTGFAKSIVGINIGLRQTAESLQYFTGHGFTQLPRSLGAWMRLGNTKGWSKVHSLSAFAGQQLLPYTRGVATYGLGAAGALLGSHIGESGSTLSGLASIGGGVGGVWLGSKIGNALPGWIAKFAPMLLGFMSSPAGWISATVAALAAATGGYFIYQDQVKKATAATVDFQNTVASSNGINWSEQASAADKYLQIVYNKQLSVNQQLIEYLKLRKEELGLMENASGIPMKDIEKYAGLFDKYDRLKYGQLKKLAKDPSSGLHLSTYLTPDTAGWMLQKNFLAEYNGVKFSGSNKLEIASQVQAARLLAALGSDMTAGSENQRIRDDYIYRYLGTSDIKAYNAISDEWQKAKESMLSSIAPGSKRWYLPFVGDSSEDITRTGYHYITTQVKTLDEAFSSHPALAAYSAMLKARESTGAIPVELLKNFLISTGVGIFDESKYGKFGSPEFMKIFGYDGSTWNPVSYKAQKLDKDGNPMFSRDGKPIYDVMNLKTADEARRAFDAFHQQIIEIVKRISPQIQPYFEGILNDATWSFASQHKNGDKTTYDGIEWTYRDGTWEAPSPTGRSPMSERAMKNAQNRDTSPTSPSASTFSGNGGYTNQYQSASAAPKQIILTIGNLMNLEHIDLTNPTNVAVVEDIKGQLAQALVDVVSDFSINMGNMA